MGTTPSSAASEKLWYVIPLVILYVLVPPIVLFNVVPAFVDIPKYLQYAGIAAFGIASSAGIALRATGRSARDRRAQYLIVNRLEGAILWFAGVHILGGLAHIGRLDVAAAFSVGIGMTLWFLEMEAFQGFVVSDDRQRIFAAPGWWRRPQLTIIVLAVTMLVFGACGVIGRYVIIEYWIGSPESQPDPQEFVFPWLGAFLSVPCLLCSHVSRREITGDGFLVNSGCHSLANQRYNATIGAPSLSWRCDPPMIQFDLARRSGRRGLRVLRRLFQ